MDGFGALSGNYSQSFLIFFIFATLVFFIISKVLGFTQKSLKGFMRTGLQLGLAVLAAVVLVSVIIGIVYYIVDGSWQMGMVFLMAVGGGAIAVFSGAISGLCLSYVILPIKHW